MDFGDNYADVVEQDPQDFSVWNPVWAKARDTGGVAERENLFCLEELWMGWMV
jgi:hypothetical protein